MDLSKLSDADLIALQSGDITKLSDDALMMISEQQSKPIQKSTPQPSQSGYMQDAGNFLAGAARGAGSIGATLLSPIDYLARQANQGQPINIGGYDIAGQDRRAGMEQGLRNMGADPESGLYTAGKIGAEIAGTAGIGNLLSKALLATTQSPRALQIAEALKTGGMSARGAGMGTRVGAGAVTGAATAGAVSPESTITGAVVGGALPPAVKGAAALGKGVGSTIEPLYQAGRQRIIGRTIDEIAGNQADDVLRNLQNYQPLVAGSEPTVGMIAKSPSVAALERAAMSSGIATNELAGRQSANALARVNALEGLIPDRALAEQARNQATQSLYSQTAQAPVKITNELATLLQRPSMQSAITRASNLADEAGERLDLNNLTGRSAQYIKMALDDMASSAPMSGIGGNELRSIQLTRQAYLDELGKQIPQYLEANKQYAALSAPLSQADIIEEIGRKGKSFEGNLTPAAFARALSDKTAQSVTGRQSATLQNTLTPEQLGVLQNIQNDLLNLNFSQRAGTGVNSTTTQQLAYNNMLNQLGIPNAVRGMAPAGVLGNILGQAGKVAYSGANRELSEQLAQALLNPRQAAQMIEKSRQGAINPRIKQLIQQGLRTTPVLTAQ